jgi:hypothetical protein
VDFDFLGKKKDETKPEETPIASEFEQKVHIQSRSQRLNTKVFLKSFTEATVLLAPQVRKKVTVLVREGRRIDRGGRRIKRKDEQEGDLQASEGFQRKS